MKLHILSKKKHKTVIFNEIIDLGIKKCSARPGVESDTYDIQVQRSSNMAMPLRDE